jgi:D-serine deaminase-like pyridoxal phosphate-dependent protein
MQRPDMRRTDSQNAAPREITATVGALATPALLLDKDRLDRNLARLSSRMAAAGVVLRPHMKTAKSIEVAQRAYPSGPGPITVSTLARLSTSRSTVSVT